MKLQAEENLELRRYLLRDLTEEDTLRVEARLFLESEYLKQLQAAEDDLVDEYVYGELSIDERKRLETYFFSDPQRYENLKIAKALKKYLSTEHTLSSHTEDAANLDAIVLPPPQTSFWAFIKDRPPVFKLLLASVIFVLAVGGLWLIFNIVRKPDQSRLAQTRQPPPQGGEVNPERPRDLNGINGQEGKKNPQDEQGQPGAQNNREPMVNSNDGASTRIDRQSNREAVNPPIRRQRPLFVLLVPGGLARDVGVIKRVVPANARVVNFQLGLINEGNDQNYQATLQTADGRSIRTWTGLKSTASKWGEIVSVRVPANLFDQQIYSIILRVLTPSGNVRDINSYSFQIVK